MSKEIELLIRKKALKDVELWLNEQYKEIDEQLRAIEKEQDEI